MARKTETTPKARPALVKAAAKPARPISLEIAAATCASARTVHSTAALSGLEVLDADDTRREIRSSVAAIGATLLPVAGDLATRGALHRIVATLVARAIDQGRLYQHAMSESHAASARVMQSGSEPSERLTEAARRLSRAAAEAALTSYAMLAAAEGAAMAYADVTGQPWVPEVRDGEAPGVRSA